MEDKQWWCWKGESSRCRLVSGIQSMLMTGASGSSFCVTQATSDVQVHYACNTWSARPKFHAVNCVNAVHLHRWGKSESNCASLPRDPPPCLDTLIRSRA